MTQRVDYSFAAAPRELGGEWYACSFFERALGGEIFRLTRGEWWHGGGEWRSALCLALSVNGPERPSVKRALSKLLERGLIEVDGALIRVRFTSQPGPTQVASRSSSGRGEVASRSGSGLVEVGVRSGSGRIQIEPNAAESLDSCSVERVERVEREEGKEARAKPLRGRPSPARLIPVLLEETRAEAFRRGMTPAPSVLPSQQQTAASRVQELLDGGTYRDAQEAVHALVAAAFDHVERTKRGYGLALLDAVVAPPAPEFREHILPWGSV